MVGHEASHTKRVPFLRTATAIGVAFAEPLRLFDNALLEKMIDSAFAARRWLGIFLL